MNKKINFNRSSFGMIAIILGAFTCPKKILLPEQLVTFETGVRYQMYHALF
jgi:uncharacterized membrane protein YgdD (TMEM256/DUF423 family)